MQNPFGALAQLGERLICIQEVRSSILLGSTINSLVSSSSKGLEESMKICAITMVYRDYWALSQWYAYYSRHLGSEHLYIVAHGYDAKIAELCPRANVITVPRDDLSGFDRIRGHLLNGLQDGLGALYDWVIRTDADELICLDPERFADFESLFTAQHKANSTFALGLNLVEGVKDAVLPEHAKVFAYRQTAVFSGHYSKAWAVRRGAHLVRHGIEVQADYLAEADLNLPKGVYLVHLKYANTAALTCANQHRTEIANGTAKGLPGKLWSQATTEAERFYNRVATLPELEWERARTRAYRIINRNPVRDTRLNVLRAKSVNFEYRTNLPDWFKDS